MLRLLLVVLAVGLALLPVSAAFIERWYSGWLYPAVQPRITGLSNLLPFAALDGAVAVILILFAASVVRAWRRRGAISGVFRALWWLVTAGAVVLVLFLLTWGYNYRRVPLEEKLRFDRARVTPAAAQALAATAVERVNRGYAAAHASSFDRAALHESFARAHAELGGRGEVRFADPKESLAEHYFRYAAIDGMTVPVFLEVILNPDLLPVEVPFTYAHEQAHIAGYADESEANFVAWLASVRSDDPLAQYSGWLHAYIWAVNALPREARGSLPTLAEGPRQDLRAIADRVGRASPTVRAAARGVYDSYLKANRIDEGIGNYAVVLQLLLGSSFDERWKPVLR